MAKTKSKERSKDQTKAVVPASTTGRGAWRTRLLLVVLALLVVAFFRAGGIVGFANSMANYAINNKQLESAEKWLSASKSLTSSNAYSDFLNARIARKRGKLDVMSDHLKNSFKNGFSPLRLEREQALASANLGRLTDEVEGRLNAWMQEPDAEYAEIVDAYANGLTTVSRFEDAMALLQTWEQSMPTDSTSSYRIARICEHLAQPDNAEASYRKAIERDPNNSKALYHLARVLLDLRRSDEALKLFEKCNSGDASLAAKVGMARCYKTLGENEVAKDILKEVLQSSYESILGSYRAVDESPARFVAASELGCIETELGEFSDARLHLEMALNKFPLDSIARYSYAVTLRGLGMATEAEDNFAITRASRAALDQVTALQSKLRENPEDTESRIRIGRIVLEHESEQTGLFWIQSVFSYDPANIEAHTAMAEFFEGKKSKTSDDEVRIAYHRSFTRKK